MDGGMTSTVRLGRVAGFEIGAHWSLLLVVVLLVWSLADGVFPATNPGLADGTYLAMAVVASVLFFASIVLHELGHAVQARRDGVPIEGITLWVFGGVARLRGEPPTAGAELRMAIAGPAVSLAIGAVCLLAALALPLPDAVDGVLFWLGQINLYLLVFNLIPALPLDGGRVLRAILWGRRGDFLSATRTAGRLGRGFGQAMIAIGLLLVVFVGAFSGVWLAFLGWFLLAAAEAELETAASRVALSGLTVRDAMVREPVTVDADATVQQFMDRVFFPTRHTAFPVLDDDGRVAGIVSFRQALDLPRTAWSTVPVRAIMLPAGETCVDADAPLAEVLPRLATSDLRRLLVCRDGRLAGLLSFTEVARLMEVRTRSAWPAPEDRGAAPAQAPAGRAHVSWP
jgi:Zn-dependent protease/CBS domain-containing protein